MMMMITKVNGDVQFVSSLGNIEVEGLCRNTPSLCLHVVDLPPVVWVALASSPFVAYITARGALCLLGHACWLSPTHAGTHLTCTAETSWNGSDACVAVWKLEGSDSNKWCREASYLRFLACFGDVKKSSVFHRRPVTFPGSELKRQNDLYLPN